MEYNALVGIYNVTIYKNVDFKTNLYLDCSSSTKQKYTIHEQNNAAMNKLTA